MTRDAEAELFVLGLMDDATSARAALDQDADWNQAVGRARDRLLPLDLSATEIPLSPGTWDRIADRLERPAPVSKGKFRIHRFVPTGIAAALALAVGLYAGSHLPQTEPVVVAVLMDEAGAPRAVIEDYGRSTARIRFVSDVALPEGRQMQVWTLPSPQTGPVSMGVLEADASKRLTTPDTPRPAQGQLYEITLEPIGGSTTGKPTGAILAKGFAELQRQS